MHTHLEPNSNNRLLNYEASRLDETSLRIRASRFKIECKSKILARVEAVCAFLLATILIISSASVQCQEAAQPALDVNTLATLATNIGSNPQIMSMVSSLLSPTSTPQRAATGQADVASSASAATNDQDQSLIAQQDSGVALRRNTRQDPTVISGSSVTKQPPVGQENQNSLNGLLSMVPNMLSSLTGSGGQGAIANLASSLGPLGSLLGLNKLAQPAGSQAIVGASRSESLDASSSQPAASTTSVSSKPVGSPNSNNYQTAASATASAGAAAITNNNNNNNINNNNNAAQAQPAFNSAQTVINQVLTAYAAGQIPNELIQLGLSGRVPPQIIELALSGQVPPQIIQMVITGQVPMSTINTFLNSMQPNVPMMESTAAAAAVAAPKSSTGSSRTGLEGGLISATSGVFSTTRNLFELLFNSLKPRTENQQQQQQQQNSLSLPTLLGPIPLRLPTLPNVRSIGKLVGGTITNVASMIPF